MMPLYYKLFYVSLDLGTVSHTSLLWRCHHTGRNWGDPSNYHRTLRAVFNWVSIVITQLLWSCIATVCVWLETESRATFSIRSTQSEVKPKTNRDLPARFPRAWRRLHVFPSSSDWFIELFTTVLIGQSNNFSFGITTLNWKPLWR